MPPEWTGSPRELLIGRSPDPGSSLPVLLRLPVAGGPPILLATRETWPGAKDLYCHELRTWPEGAEVLERHAVQACWRKGRAVHLVLERSRKRRSLFVWTQSRTGKRLIFWRTQRTMRGARPGVRVPQARGLDRALEIAVDHRERYAWRFEGQKASTVKRELPAGDYGVLLDGKLVAAIERKTAGNLVSDAVDGRLAMTLGELSLLPSAALVVEGRLSEALKNDYVDSGWLLSLFAALQVTHPRVGWTFAESRTLAQDFAFRWLAAARKAALEGTPDEPTPPGAIRAPDIAERRADTREPEPERRGVPVLDRAGRRSRALELAEAGRVWTSRAYAEHFGVSHGTAWKDLKALVDEGALATEGARKNRRYVLA